MYMGLQGFLNVLQIKGHWARFQILVGPLLCTIIVNSA